MERSVNLMLVLVFVFSLLILNLGSSVNFISVCGSGCDYRNIQDAIDAADYGDFVEITDFRTYYENIEINGDGITLDCGGATITDSTAYACIKILGSENVIENCEIMDCRRAISIIGEGPFPSSRSHDNKILDNDLHDNLGLFSWEGYGIEVRNSNEVRIEDNWIENNGGDGINAEYMDLSVMEGNIITNNSRHGISIDYSDDFANNITNNNIESNGEDGIHFGQVWYDWIGSYDNSKGNFIGNNGRHGIYTAGAHSIKIINNIIKNNSKDGVHANGDEYDIIENLINYNENGIYTDSYGHKIKDNTLWFNKYGFYADTVYLSRYPKHEIFDNDFCYYGESSEITDIYLTFGSSSSFGDDNSCQTTYNFDDNGSVGCTYKCIHQDCIPGSGPCCDEHGNYRLSTYKCEDRVNVEFGCPWGTGCGEDVGVREQNRYCSGSSYICGGGLVWTIWVPNDYCTSSEVCVLGNNLCQEDIVCSGGLGGDTNGDCKVDILDLARVGLCYGGEASGSCEGADLNSDGIINIFDLAEVGINYGNVY